MKTIKRKYHWLFSLALCVVCTVGTAQTVNDITNKVRISELPALTQQNFSSVNSFVPLSQSATTYKFDLGARFATVDNSISNLSTIVNGINISVAQHLYAFSPLMKINDTTFTVDTAYFLLNQFNHRQNAQSWFRKQQVDSFALGYNGGASVAQFSVLGTTDINNWRFPTNGINWGGVNVFDIGADSSFKIGNNSFYKSFAYGTAGSTTDFKGAYKFSTAPVDGSGAESVLLRAADGTVHKIAQNLLVRGGDSTVTNFIASIADSTLTANVPLGLQAQLSYNNNLTQPNSIQLHSSKFSFMSAKSSPASATTQVGAIVAPQSITLLVAPKLGVNLLRYGTVIKTSTTFAFQTAANSGYDVFLTINYKPFNGKTDGSTDFVTSSQLAQFSTDFRSFLHNKVKGYATKISIENEENNFSYRPNWVAKDYIAELSTATKIGHDSGFAVTNGGLTGTYFDHWVWQWLHDRGRTADADTFAKYRFTPSEIPNLNNWANISQFSVGKAKMDSLVAAYDTIPLNWINFHFNAPTDSTQQSINVNVWGFAAEALSAATHKTAITNETSQSNFSPTIPVQLLTKAVAINMPYFIWYSGDSPNAIALQDSVANLRPNGQAFAAYVQGTLNTRTDTSNVEALTVQQGALYVPAYKKSYVQLMMLDTTGKLIAIDTTNLFRRGGGGFVDTTGGDCVTPDLQQISDIGSATSRTLFANGFTLHNAGTGTDLATLVTTSNAATLNLTQADAARTLGLSSNYLRFYTQNGSTTYTELQANTGTPTGVHNVVQLPYNPNGTYPTNSYLMRGVKVNGTLVYADSTGNVDLGAIIGSTSSSFTDTVTYTANATKLELLLYTPNKIVNYVTTIGQNGSGFLQNFYTKNDTTHILYYAAPDSIITFVLKGTVRSLAMVHVNSNSELAMNTDNFFVPANITGIDRFFKD